ncbi:putative transcription factor NAM family [Rosa chinensis]|uniref:Putative transcription factor NAM family n=1 Tax=Rosa chinensis TaxID=74649 RepID=A0A2P6PAF8_ROSCH|nr:putative transcription factor NAM family [Rosa chinensis]
MEESRGNQLPGQRFCPMDDELVLFYLKPMLSGQNVPGRSRVVFDCDLYGQQEPWEIWEAFKTRRPHDLRLNKDIYFFTQHKKMSSTDKRVRRNVGSGTWKGDDSGKPVRSVDSGCVVGLKKRYTYKNEDSVHNGCWILYEFYLDRSLRDKKQKVKDCVLCLLRKNGEPKTKIEKKRKQREEEQFLENNYACDDGENSNREQEVLLEPQAKRQRTVPSIDNAPPTMPSEDDAAFAAELEESLECSEDDNAPSSEAEAVGLQGEENGGLQKLASEGQSSGPSFVDDYGIFNQLPEEDFLWEEMVEEMGTVEKEEPVLNGVSSNIDVDEDNAVNSTLLYAPTSSMSVASDGCTEMPYLSENCCIDPSGSNNVCGGSIGLQDAAYWLESLVEVPIDEQQKTADEDCSDWLESMINFSPEENNFLWSEMQWCS